jgi:hypothetical protein
MIILTIIGIALLVVGVVVGIGGYLLNDLGVGFTGVVIMLVGVFAIFVPVLLNS